MIRPAGPADERTLRHLDVIRVGATRLRFHDPSETTDSKLTEVAAQAVVPQLTPAQLTAARDATVRAAGKPGIHRHTDFILYNEPGRREKRHLLVRAKLRRLQESLLLR